MTINDVPMSLPYMMLASTCTMILLSVMTLCIGPKIGNLELNVDDKLKNGGVEMVAAKTKPIEVDIRTNSGHGMDNNAFTKGDETG